MRMNHITKLSVVVLAFLFLGTFLVSTSPAWGSCRIKNISLKKEGNFTQVCVYADKPFEFFHSTEEAKEGKPYRVIIDCMDAIFDLPQHNFKKGLPPGTIKAIRTSQFQAVPERIVRVVLDLNGPVVYKVTDTGTEKKATIAILTTQDPDFPMWVAVEEEGRDQKRAMEKKHTPVPSTTTASRKELESDQSQAYLPSAESFPDVTASEKGEAKLAQKERINRRVVCYADTGEVVLPAKKKPILLSQTETEDKDVTREKEIVRIAEKRALPPEPEVSLEPTKSLSDQVNAEGIKGDKIQGDVSSPSAKLVLKPTSQTKAEKDELPSVSLSGSERSLPKPSPPKRQISRSPVPLGPLPEDRSSTTETSEKAKVKKDEAEEKKDVSTPVPGSAERGIDGILGPEPAAARESQMPVESLIIIQGSQESELGLVPQRKMVFYHPGTRRDPFLPLTEREDMSFGEAPMPLFENLTLVGILKDEEGNRALLESKMGFGYILMSGDKIKNGYVIRVEDDRAIFHVEEYGGYQIMVLELNPEY